MADMAWIGLFYLCLLLCTESGVAYGRCTAPSSADMQLFAVGLDWIPHRIRRNRNVKSGTIVMAICKKYPEQLPRMYNCLDGVWKPDTPTCKISQRWTHTKPTMSVTQTTILNMEDTTTEAAKISTEAAPSETEPLCPVIEKPFYNGEIVYMDERRLHSVAKFMCNEEEAELLPEALREMECLDNKQWSLTENEIPSCYKWAFVPKVQNGDLYHVAQFRSTLMNEELKVPHEHEVVLKCHPGWEAFRESENEYLDVESERISSNSNGTWEPPIADCVPARCHLQKFTSTYNIKYSDGTSVDRKIHHDDNVLVTCANSSYEFQTREPLVIEKCSKGVITLPPCVPKSCKAPDRTTYPRLAFSANNPSWFIHGVEATAVCTDATEYEVYNNDTKTFTASYLSRCSFGSWRPVYGCVEKHCDLAASDGVLYLDSFTHETILPGRDIINSGESVIYACTEGYDLMALPNLERHKTAMNTCYRGVWTRNLTCEPKNCLPPDIMTYYGVVFSSSSTNTQSFNHGTMAKAVCTNATEYEIYNDDTKTFTESYQSTCSFGIWKPMYSCVEKHCDLAESDGVLYLNRFTNKSIFPKRDIISGESVLYSCSEGYNLMEYPIPERPKTVTRTTCNRGVWSRNLTCEPSCMAPDSNTYYGVVLSSPSTNTGYFSHSTMENAVCNSTDYEIYNDDTKTYTNSFLSTCSFGFWKPMYGCVEKHCDLAASNGVLYQESSSQRNISQWRGLASGDSVLFSCAVGYDLMSHGNLERHKVVVNTCNRGVWSKNLTCEPKTCILLDTNVSPGVVFSSSSSNNGSFKHGITATVTCTNEDEYEIQDVNKTDEFKPSYTSTCSYGSWSHEYKCVEKRCMLRNEPNIVYNVNDTNVISTSNVTVSCRSGYKLYDENRKMFLDIDQGAISCTKGKLTPDINCLKRSCKAPDSTMYPRLKFSHPSSKNDWFDHDITATAICANADEYEIYDNKTGRFADSYQSRCSFGSWTFMYGCVEKHCDLAASEEMRYEDSSSHRAMSAGRNITSGESVLFSCAEGYDMMDNGNRNQLETVMNTCNKGIWSKNLTCKPSCRIPDEYSILMMNWVLMTNEVNVDRKVQVNDTATIKCDVYQDYGVDSMINITCLEHGKFDRDLDPCQVQTVDCPHLDHGTVEVLTPGIYSVVCKKGYRLSNTECRFTECSNQSFTCGNVTCEPQNCKLKASAGTLSNNELKKKETIELAHNSSIIVGCDDGLEPAAVLYTCSFGYISGNSTEYPTQSGKMPLCRKAVCDLCNNGECIRDETCRCFHGYDGPYCDPVLLCEPLCLENGGQCTITGQCLCSTGRTGANCELGEYRIALERGWFAGTFGTVWIEVIGARDSFKQELTGVYNTFGKRLKLRYTLKGIYVGEISNVLITTSQSVVPNVGYVAIYSSEDRKYYRFEAGNKRRSMCVFQRRDGTPWTNGYNTKHLRPAENAEECQLSCVAENGCVLARFDKRTKTTTSADLRHTCIAFLWGYNLVTAQTAGVEIYVKYCN